MSRPGGPRRAKTWLRKWKTRLGYYDLRRRLRRPRFRRSLRPTDTFLVGHPKSGNTWLAYMLAILLRPERSDDVTLLNVGEYVPFVHGRDHRIGRYGELPDPRVFRNEDPQYPDLYPRIIYLVRDPRAALVSLWHMYTTMFDVSDLPFATFLDQYMRSDGIFDWWNSKLERWDRQVTATLDRAETAGRPEIVTYEGMVRDRRAVLDRLVGFLDVDPPPGAVERAVERGAFEAMRRDEERHGSEAYEGRAEGEGRFIRKGRIDGWRDELDPEQEARIIDAFGDPMRRMGYL